jgi:hypothetical protein
LKCELPNINEFSAYAGLKLNIAKTEGIKLGRLKHKEMNFKDINWTIKPIRCLGIYVGHDKNECLWLNWTNKLDEMQKLLDTWRTRDLTLFGKVTIIKVLAISKLVFSALNTHTPENIEKDISKMLYSFIWNKTDRIKRNVIISPMLQGGLTPWLRISPIGTEIPYSNGVFSSQSVKAIKPLTDH